ncbi:hypothetical protein ACOBV9_22210 (plasmid) [Pseudoalteromonas espejiana]
MGKELEFGKLPIHKQPFSDAADLSFRLPKYQLVGVFGQVNLTECPSCRKC